MKNVIRKELRALETEIKKMLETSRALAKRVNAIDVVKLNAEELEWIDNHLDELPDADELWEALSDVVRDALDEVDGRDEEDVVVRNKNGKLSVVPRNRIRGRKVVGVLEDDER